MLATSEQITCACDGRGRLGAMIAGARALVFAAMRENIQRSEINPSDPELARYLTLKFLGCTHEELHAIFVDEANGFIAEELFCQGATRHLTIRLAPIVRRAFELGAKGIYLVHNHPSGSPTPSKEDIQTTRRVAEIAGALEIVIVDHLIVAGDTITSMRGLGLL
jgi:DNA repair protein RadC